MNDFSKKNLEHVLSPTRLELTGELNMPPPSTPRPLPSGRRHRRRRLLIVGIVFLFIGLGIVVEAGWVDLPLRKALLSTSRSFSKVDRHASEGEAFSYHLSLRFGPETLFEHTYIYFGRAPLEIRATLEIPDCTGYDRLPLFKSFTMTYLCKFTSTETSQSPRIEGKMEGAVKAKIVGFCASAKARDIAFAEVTEQVSAYLRDHLKP
ncbi:hypothetical protein ACFL6U_10460 [Planctomycetota bacterium]